MSINAVNAGGTDAVDPDLCIAACVPICLLNCLVACGINIIMQMSNEYENSALANIVSHKIIC